MSYNNLHKIQDVITVDGKIYAKVQNYRHKMKFKIKPSYQFSILSIKSHVTTDT